MYKKRFDQTILAYYKIKILDQLNVIPLPLNSK